MINLALHQKDDEALANLRNEVSAAYNVLSEEIVDNEVEDLGLGPIEPENAEDMEVIEIEDAGPINKAPNQKVNAEMEKSMQDDNIIVLESKNENNLELDNENEIEQSNGNDDVDYRPSQDSASGESELLDANNLNEINQRRNGNNTKRKRKPDKQKWKREENKMMRQKGEKYHGAGRTEGGKLKVDTERTARKLKPHCNCKLSSQNTTLQCRMFSEVDRQNIYNYFWKQMTWPERRVFVHTLVDVIPVQNKKNQVHEISHRSNTLMYHLKKDGIRLRVCQTMLLNTLSIGTWSLQNWSKSLKENEIDENTQAIPERRSSRFTQEKATLRDFLQILPKMESHYCRASSTKLYLEPIWQSKSAVYNQYIKYCEEKEINPLSIKTFHDEFAELNLGLFRPKKDQCDQCISFKVGNTTEEIYQRHINKKNLARQEKTMDKEIAQHVYTMDLQSTLLCPMLKASAIYYKKKLVVHNFTLYNLKTKDGYCFIWNEVEGHVTANEFSSIIYHFLATYAQIQPGEEVILYSDGCSYQNRNCTLSNALLHLANVKSITITQKYLVSGHTQMECDSMHSCIERKLKNREIYSPACYISAAKEARMNPRPFQVEYIRHTFFKDFSNLKNYNSIRPGSKPGDPTVTDLCALQYSPGCKIKYKLEFSSDWADLERRTRSVNLGNGKMENLYKKQVPIKKSKYDHLQQLKNVIPSDYHLFYETLPYISD